MHTIVRAATALTAAAGLTVGAASWATASTASDGNRFEATFLETTVSVTNRVADLGIFQLVNTGTGSVDGRGEATMTMSNTQDRTVQPCGPGSWTNAVIRRITLDAGVLVLRTLAYVCQTPTGPHAFGTWEVDGPSSTGVFAGARGQGVESVDIPTRRATLSGKLKLAGGRD